MGPDVARPPLRALDLAASALRAGTAAAAGRLFLERLRPLGIRALYARAHRSGTDVSRPAQDYARLSPPCYDGMYSDGRYAEHNVIPRVLARSFGPVRWTAMPWRTPEERWVYAALRDNGSPDGLAIPCHGPGGYFGVMSLAYSEIDQFSPEEEADLTVAALVLHAHMRRLSPHRAGGVLGRLTIRERDCLAFVAEGRTGTEIASLMGVSESTVATHVANARQKLGARTRAQAVAVFLAEGG